MENDVTQWSKSEMCSASLWWSTSFDIWVIKSSIYYYSVKPSISVKTEKMKLSILLAGSIAAEKTAFQRKEWEVQDAYFAGDDVILSDPRIRMVFSFQ